MAQLGPFPSPGWSTSRGADLTACPRLYYHRTWGSWQGWTDDPRHPAWLAYRLKFVTSFRQQVGVTIHGIARDVVQTLVRGAALPSIAELERRGREDLQRLRATTLADWLRAPKRNAILPERLYGGVEYVPELYDEALEHLYTCITNLLDSDALEEISRCRPEQVLVTDSLDAMDYPLPDGSSLTVWAAPDLAYWGPDDEDVITILDWKTGSSQSAGAQIATYALYLHHRHGVPLVPGSLRGRVVSLATYRDAIEEISQDDTDAARERIWSDVQEIRRYTADAEVNLPIERNLFAMLEGKDRRRCGYCAYRMLCDPLRHEEPSPPPTAGTIDIFDDSPLDLLGL